MSLSTLVVTLITEGTLSEVEHHVYKCECSSRILKRTSLRHHLKSKLHLENVKKNILLQICGEHINLIPREEDQKTISERTFKSHNYYQYIKAAQLIGRQVRDYRAVTVFPSVSTVQIYDEIRDELLKQADRIMRMNKAYNLP